MYDIPWPQVYDTTAKTEQVDSYHVSIPCTHSGSPMPAFTPFIALILWGCMWWILAWLIPG